MKQTTIALIIAIILIGGTLTFVLKNPPTVEKSKNETEYSLPANNVSLVDGKQVVEITARGGYQPRKSVAKAGLPTIIRFNTNGTFDCSSSVRIPSLNISKILPSSGITDIEIGTSAVGTLAGTCGMGMYPFEIEFQS